MGREHYQKMIGCGATAGRGRALFVENEGPVRAVLNVWLITGTMKFILTRPKPRTHRCSGRKLWTFSTVRKPTARAPQPALTTMVDCIFLLRAAGGF